MTVHAGKFYHHLDDDVALSFGLQRMRSDRCGARFGFPVLHEAYYCQCLLQQGELIFIHETA